MLNAADRKSVRAAQKAADLAEQNRASIIATLASSPEGRRYLWDQLAESHIFSSTYSDEPQRMAFLEGQRAVGLRLLDDIVHFAPDNFIQAMREANDRRTASDRTAGQRSGTEGPDGDAFGESADEDGAGAEG